MAVDDPGPEFDPFEEFTEEDWAAYENQWLELLDDAIWDFIEDVLEGDY